MAQNYQLILDKTIEQITLSEQKPRLLLQCCCAPCSSYVLEYLSEFFDITLFFYNPNMSSDAEYDKRAKELVRLVGEMGLNECKTLIEPYNPQEFFEIAKGKEMLAEGGERCFACYRLRLEKTAKKAKDENFDYFCTTLSISPHKRADKLNEIGGELSEIFGVKYLYSDFKKNNGYIRSIELSRKFDLYRQNFCGCVYSKKQSENRN